MRYNRRGFREYSFGYESTYTPANGERDYVHNYYPPEMHHSGLDEGYYYDDCPHCGRRTEHDNGACLPCSH